MIIQSRMFRSMIASGILSYCFWGNVTNVKAQISADDTTNTQVDQSGDTAEITGGRTQGANLFHSFEEFSLTSGTTASFNNSVQIENIISRVTGNGISDIDGLIRANGSSNLILLNPNGINFGANARLDIGGSFLGSTANSLVFADGTVFEAGAGEGLPQLTVSVPIGLQLGQNSGEITIQGVGNNISLSSPIFSPYNRGEVTGLKLESSKTLGLIGGGITLTGGIVASETGKVEIGSVGAGLVELEFTGSDFSLDYEGVSAFKDINLEQESLIDVSGINSGSVEIWGNDITINDGSVVLTQNLGETASGDLTIYADRSLAVNGTNAQGQLSSSLSAETLAAGQGGEISIVTPKLEIIGGGAIVNSSFGSGASGNIQLEIADSLQIIGFSSLNPNRFSSVSALALGAGGAGSIAVTTKSLTILNGGNIASVAGGLGTGSGGNISIDATESIEFMGVNPIAFAPSQVTAGSGGAGKAGNVSLTTKNLIVKNGGRVDASATATGNAGNLTIDATESIMVTGTVPGSINPSLIIASANILDPELRLLLGLPDQPQGNSGNIDIQTPLLKVMDGGQVTVRNDGTGNAGNLQIKSDSIELNSGGGITAAVDSGEGGTINLEVSNSLNIASSGQIVSDNRGVGDGGEIAIAANSLNLTDGGFITTTSFGSGAGGDISLNIAQALTIEGVGFTQLQETFLATSLNGTLEPGTRGSGIFIGTAADGRGGNLEITADSLSLKSGGIIFSPVFTEGIGGNVNIDANDISISGSALQINTGLDSIATATAGNIDLETQRLRLEDGGFIINATFGDAAGGNITINAQEFIELQDTPNNSPLFTGIYANTSRGLGKGGSISLVTDNLLIDDAFVSSNTGGFIDDGLDIEGGGDAGNITISAADTIKIAGIRTPNDPRFASGVSSTSFTSGAAGNIEIASRKLLVQDGAEIAATAIGSGAGGNLTIDATDSIELIGKTTVKNMRRGGLITASGSEAFPQRLASGASGDITVRTQDLNVRDVARIDVQSLATGEAGNLNLEVTDTLSLDTQGTISAASNSGRGGNINIDAGNIFWRGNSTTTATAQNDGDGGNIKITGNNLVVLESSTLTADANVGDGGNIDIDAQGLFICSECVVSASSRLGIDGVVDINTLEPNSNLGIVSVPIKLTSPEEVVAQACSTSQNPNNSSFTVSGRGGLPTRPSEPLTGESVVRFDAPDQPKSSVGNSTSALPAPAHGWYVNEQGVVVLTAQSTAANNTKFEPDCHVR